MADMNYDGTVCVDKVYTEHALELILHISRDQMLEYYRLGLQFFQRTRKEPRQISGAEYHRFIERNSREWPDDGDGDAE